MTNKISILSVGKLPSEYKTICDHYLKMLGKNISIKEIIVKKKLEGIKAMKEEAKEILSKLRINQQVILLDVKGKSPDSHEFAKIIDSSDSEICFIIGGAFGVSEEIKKRADRKISLSPLTFPHMLARIILLEQIYRAKSIIAGHPYHKD